MVVLLDAETIEITEEIRHQIRKGIEIAGSKGALARELGIYRSGNRYINYLLSDMTRTINNRKYKRLKKYIDGVKQI